jgi:hypothetical protein
MSLSDNEFLARFLFYPFQYIFIEKHILKYTLCVMPAAILSSGNLQELKNYCENLT